jgi:transposase InsO family protein
MPKAHPGHSSQPAINPQWVEYALAQLEQEAARSLFTLTLNIRDKFGLQARPAKSSLHAALKRHPRYLKIKKRQGQRNRARRRRFQAKMPHELWHGDAKACFWVRFVDGSRRRFRLITLLDDATRYVLRGLVVTSESIRAAVSVFRQAAGRYGLPLAFYADRGSPYDSYVFRQGLAILGVRRINTRPRNPSAHGKIEAFHRAIHRWFVKELAHQLVLDEIHLQQLFDAVIAGVYHIHVHRELKMSPCQAFQGSISDRFVTLDRLREAFLEKKELCPNKRTGNVRVHGILFRLPSPFCNHRKVELAIDPEEPSKPYLVVKPGTLRPLEPAVKKVTVQQDRPDRQKPEPVGSLTPLLERYRGRTLPKATAGFGLPEIYEALSHAMGRSIPSTEAEATLIVDWLCRSGPFEQSAFQAALARSVRHLGRGRPLAQILRELDGQISRPSHTKEP